MTLPIMKQIKSTVMENLEVDKLEILKEMKQRFPEWLNPEIQSIKLCQNEELIFLEILFHKEFTRALIISKLDFIADDDDLSKILFTPEKEITDNAIEFLALDPLTILMCEEKIFTEESHILINNVRTV